MSIEEEKEEGTDSDWPAELPQGKLLELRLKSSRVLLRSSCRMRSTCEWLLLLRPPV